MGAYRLYKTLLGSVGSVFVVKDMSGFLNVLQYACCAPISACKMLFAALTKELVRAFGRCLVAPFAERHPIVLLLGQPGLAE